MYESPLLVGRPDVFSGILSNVQQSAVTRAGDGDKPVLFEKSDLASRGHPYSAALVLKKGGWRQAIEPPIALVVGGDSSISPPIEPGRRGDPNASILSRQNRSCKAIREALFERQGSDRSVPEPIQSVVS